MRGGLSNAGTDCGIFFVNVAIAASHANWPIGAALLLVHIILCVVDFLVILSIVVIFLLI